MYRVGTHSIPRVKPSPALCARKPVCAVTCHNQGWTKNDVTLPTNLCKLPRELGVVRGAVVIIRHEKVGRFASGKFDLLQVILLWCTRGEVGVRGLDTRWVCDIDKTDTLACVWVHDGRYSVDRLGSFRQILQKKTKTAHPYKLTKFHTRYHQ